MCGGWRLVTVVLLLFVAAGCGGGAGVTGTESDHPNYDNGGGDPNLQPVDIQPTLPPVFSDPTPEDGVTLDIIGGQQYLGGHVNFWTDDEFFYLSAWTVDGWEMSVIDLYIGNTPPDGQGSPGQFPYHYGPWDPFITSYDIDPIPLSELELAFKSEVFVAVHVNIHKEGQNETAWGGDWNGGNPHWDYGWDHKWGGFMGVCLPPCPPLPAEPQAFDAIRFGNFSYWDTRFQDQNLVLPPGDYLIGNDKYYVGWCGDMAKVMYQNFVYNAQLYSSYDPDLPQNPAIKITVNGNLEFINYLINQRRNPDSGGPFDGIDWSVQANYLELQDAMWYFTNEFIPDPGSLAESLAQYAIDNGDNYIPCAGEWYSIVLYPDTSSESKEVRAQLILIEVDP